MGNPSTFSSYFQREVLLSLRRSAKQSGESSGARQGGDGTSPGDEEEEDDWGQQ